jgi:hypothetical protein
MSLSLLIATFLIQASSSFAADSTPTATPNANHQIEFESTVVEGAGKGFSGITTIRTQQNPKQLYSLQVDFTSKIRESTQDLSQRIISSDSHSKGDQP